MSKEMTRSERERFEALLMKAVDGEISQQEQAEFDTFIEQYPECKQEWRELHNLKEVTSAMKFKSPGAEVWDTYWQRVYNRLERGIAWILISLGCVILLTYGGFKAAEAIIGDPHLELIVKIGLFLAIGGGFLLVVSVVRERLFSYKHDPYKEVIR